jgi:uncharacterized FAD-dependent dehydrogenase
MTNFGILMEIKGIEEPFKWSRDLVEGIQHDSTGLYYSPTRKPSTTSEGKNVSAHQISNEDLTVVRNAFQGYFQYIEDFINDMKKVFPTLGDDWGMYIPEVKYLSPEPLVNYSDLSLVDYDNVHFVGDALSARGITVSGAQGIYVTDYILEKSNQEFPEFHEIF